MIDINNLKAQISALIANNPAMVDDEELRADMLEGCTDIAEVLERLSDAAADAKAMQDAIKSRVFDLTERKRRYEGREDAARDLMFKVLTEADLTKFVLPDATLSVTKGRASLREIDAASTPPAFTKTVVEPDKPSIRAALDKGEHVPGWELSNGTPTLTIRRK